MRRWLAVLCIVVILAGALLSPATGGHETGVLVALGPLFGLVIIAPVVAIAEPALDASLAAPPVPSRAPPANA